MPKPIRIMKGVYCTHKWYIVMHLNKWYLMSEQEYNKGIEYSIQSLMYTPYKTKKALIEHYQTEPYYKHIFNNYDKTAKSWVLNSHNMQKYTQEELYDRFKLKYCKHLMNRI